jgi:hypothetical protein
LAISGDPVTRPPISSVSRRKFSIIGESPRMSGISFFAASVHAEASVAEQAATLWLPCPGWSEVTFTGGSCANTVGIVPSIKICRENRRIDRI